MTHSLEPELSIHRTFVVQLLPAPASAELAGRVEHVASGRTTDFSSLQRLLDFFTEVLQAESGRRRRRE